MIIWLMLVRLDEFLRKQAVAAGLSLICPQDPALALLC
jgi:hypothetical protein